MLPFPPSPVFFVDVQFIYWFSYFNCSEPSVRYRARFPLQELAEKHEISSAAFYPERTFSSLLQFIKIYCSVLFFRKRNSLLVFQKICTTGWYARALKFLLFCRPSYTLYDIDDAEYTRQPASTMHYFMRHCTACSGGSAALVSYMQQYCKKVFLLTSPVINHGYRQRQAGVFTVGWIGYYGAHRHSLQQLFFPALHSLTFPLTLTILGAASQQQVAEIEACFQHAPQVTVQAPLLANWQDEAAVYKEICKFTIGVSPLLDTEFNRAKSAFKLKQCFSCGVPVLASAVGENPRFLQAGGNGYFCSTPADFADALTLMYNLPHPVFQDMSYNALQAAEMFSVAHFCQILIGFFK